MLDNLDLTDPHATAIVEKGIEYEVYDGDEVPSSKKDRMEAAHDLVAFAIDAWTNEGVNPAKIDKDDDEAVEAANQVQEILEWAGVEIDEEDEVEYGELPEIEGGESGDDDDGDGETPFEAEDIIEGYDDAKISDIIEIFNSGDLDQDDIRRVQEYEANNGERAKILKWEPEDGWDNDTSDDDESGEEIEEPWEDYAESSAKAIKEGFDAFAEDDEVTPEMAAGIIAYEEAQEKPKLSVIKHVKAWAEENEVDLSGDDGDDDDTDGDESEAPIEGYDDAKVPELKEAIEAAIEAEEADADTIQEIIAYEEANKNRKTFVKWLNERLENDGDDDDDGEDEKPAKKRGRPAKSKKKDDTEDVDLDDDDIEAMLPVGLAKVHVKSKMDEARKAVEEQGLELPGAYEGEMPELPNDISGVDHGTLSDLLAQFQNAHSTAITQAAQAHIWNNTYAEIADYLIDVNLIDSDQSNAEKRKAEAKTEPRVVFFRSKALHHKNENERWSKLATTLDKKGAVVSRVGGFVEGDNAQSDRRASKPSTRGAAKGATVKKTADKPAAKAKPGVKAKAKPTVKKRK